MKTELNKTSRKEFFKEAKKQASLFSTSLTNESISKRLSTTLSKVNIRTIGDLINYYPDTMSSIGGVGKKGMQELTEFLKSNGISDWYKFTKNYRNE